MDYDVIEQRTRRRETLRKTLTYFFLSIWALIVLLVYSEVLYPRPHASEL